MASVYILFSNSINKFYIGSCLDTQARLHQHLNNSFSNSFTSKAKDWILFYEIQNLDYQQARSIEQHIKSMKSSTYIKNLKKYKGISLKLIDKYNAGSCR